MRAGISYLREVVRGRLWQGSLDIGQGEVLRAGINAIMAVGDGEMEWIDEWRRAAWLPVDRDHPQRAIYVRAPLLDASGWLDEVAADALIAFGVGLLGDTNRRLLVHCDAGAFRSVHVTAGIFARLRYCEGPAAFRVVDLASGRSEPRESTGLAGWHEHVSTFGPQAAIERAMQTVRPVFEQLGMAEGDARDLLSVLAAGHLR